MKDAYANPADYDENLCRATACEVLARRIVHNLPAGRLEAVMSTRFRYRESDGDASAATSALETAIDQHCTRQSPVLKSELGLISRFSCHRLKRNMWSMHFGKEI
jgi:hypothetical protein